MTRKATHRCRRGARNFLGTRAAAQLAGEQRVRCRVAEWWRSSGTASGTTTDGMCAAALCPSQLQRQRRTACCRVPRRLPRCVERRHVPF
jgi:hypothetical protein